jgi:hypothetical protein
MRNVKRLAILLTSLGVLVASQGLIAQQPGGEVRQPVRNPARSTTGNRAVDPGIKALIEARLATAREVYESDIQRYQGFVAPPSDDTAVWSRRWMEEKLQLNPGPAETLASIWDHLERVKQLEAIAEAYARNGQGRKSDALKMRYYRLEAEQLLAEARAAHPGVPLPSPKESRVAPAPIPRRPPPAPPR